MVLVPTLNPRDIERHRRLIASYFQEVVGTTAVDIVLHGNGQEKGVYKVSTPDGAYLAAAASQDVRRRVLGEYILLDQLFAGAPRFFPRPIAHYQPHEVEATGDLYLMEFLPHLDLDRVDRHSYRGEGRFSRALAYEIGRGVAAVHESTGRYSSEPHNGNILVEIGSDGRNLDLKFCDAIQFRVGSLADGINAILINRDERPEAFRFIRQFRDGLADSLSISQGIPVEKAREEMTSLVRRYNDIF